MNIIPALMIRNEEYYIREVVQPLVDVFGVVLVCDTGSKDKTLSILASIPGVMVVQFGECSPRGLTEVRRDMMRLCKAYGASHVLLVDGDELYSREALELIKNYSIPDGGITGFTTMLTLDPDEHNNNLWEMNDPFTRHCLLPVDDIWDGEYPYDVPSSYADPAGYFYYPHTPNSRYHAVHLHRLQRSSLDGNTMLRREKQFQFGLQNLPNIVKTIPYSYPLKKEI